MIEDDQKITAEDLHAKFEKILDRTRSEIDIRRVEIIFFAAALAAAATAGYLIGRRRN